MPSAGAKNVQFKGFQTNSVFEKSRQDVGEKPSKVGEMYPIKWPGYTQVSKQTSLYHNFTQH